MKCAAPPPLQQEAVQGCLWCVSAVRQTTCTHRCLALEGFDIFFLPDPVLMRIRPALLTYQWVSV